MINKVEENPLIQEKFEKFIALTEKWWEDSGYDLLKDIMLLLLVEFGQAAERQMLERVIEAVVERVANNKATLRIWPTLYGKRCHEL